MAQQNIEYGNFPDDSAADAIRIAFQKTQQNFTELYGNLSNIASNVSSVIAGNGISVSSDTGDVTIDATFNLLNFHSNTLYVTGIGGVVTSGGNIGQDYTVNNASSTLIVELDSNTNATFNDLTASGNLIVNGNSISSSSADLTLTNGNIILTFGSFSGDIQSSSGPNTVQFSDYDGMISGDSNFTYDPLGSILSLNNGNVIAATITSEYQLNAVNVDISDTLSVSNSLSAGSIISNGNISGTNENLTGNLFVTGNIVSDGNLTADFLSGDGSQITNMSASALTSGTLSFLLLSGQYDIDITGTASDALYVTESNQSNITSVGTLNSLTVTDNISANTVTLDGSIVAASIQINSVQFTGLETDPPAADGLMYYNIVTGKLRLYNGIDDLWQDLN